MRLRTRAQLMSRLRREMKISENDDAGTYTSENLRAFLDEQWAGVWDELTENLSGFGMQNVDVVPVAGPTYDLPANFLELVSLSRSFGSGTTTYQPELTSWAEVKRLHIDSPTSNQAYMPGYYLREALPATPGGTQFSQALRFFPDLMGSETLSVGYNLQPPSLANSDGTYTDELGDAEDTTITIDVYAESIEDVFITLARVRIVSRADDKEYNRAMVQLGDAIQRLAKGRIKQDTSGGDPLRRYKTKRGWNY